MGIQDAGVTPVYRFLRSGLAEFLGAVPFDTGVIFAWNAF